MGIVEYAKTHRYRTRNLRDGRPTPPGHVDTRKRTRDEMVAEVFRSGVSDDRCDAIVGKFGYVFAQDGRHEWYLRRQVGLAKAVAGLEHAGATLDQLGDDEAAGTAPEAMIETVLAAIKVAKVKPGRPGSSGNADVLARYRADKANSAA